MLYGCGVITSVADVWGFLIVTNRCSHLFVFFEKAIVCSKNTIKIAESHGGFLFNIQGPNFNTKN